MKNLLKEILCAMLVLFIAVGMSACGTDTEVPDSCIWETVQDYMNEYMPDPWRLEVTDDKVKISAVHHPDSSNHTDTVEIRVEVELPYGLYVTTGTQTYQYTQSDDIWSEYRSGDWSDYECVFNDNLVGDWHIEWYDEEYDITIQSINGREIELECAAKAEAHKGLLSSTFCYLSANGTYTLDNMDFLYVKMDLPDGFFVSWSDTKSGKNEDFTYLELSFDLVEGIDWGHITPDICMW